MFSWLHSHVLFVIEFGPGMSTYIMLYSFLGHPNFKYFFYIMFYIGPGPIEINLNTTYK